jgi:hypothetical protein
MAEFCEENNETSRQLRTTAAEEKLHGNQRN